MDPQQLAAILETRSGAVAWLTSLGIRDVPHGCSNLLRLLETKLPADLLRYLFRKLQQQLPDLSDADLAFEMLVRYLTASRNVLSAVSLFQRAPVELHTLLKLFSVSRMIGTVLVHDPAAFELVRLTNGRPVDPGCLTRELSSEINKLTRHETVVDALRRFKRRELLRIAYGDVIGQQPIEVVMRQISILADALCQAALGSAYGSLTMKHGVPRHSDRRPARSVVLAVGRWGGCEMHYAGRLELLFVYDGDGVTDGTKQISNAEFFEKLIGDVVRLLGRRVDSGNDTGHEPTVESSSSSPSQAIPEPSGLPLSRRESFEGVLGDAYSVDVNLGPNGADGPIAVRYDLALHHYDWMGRTWERQTFIKMRPVAGDREFGEEYLARLESWIYRRYLTQADKAGIKALKRRIERRVQRSAKDSRRIDSGQGGISDIEFVIQFLQLINGGEIESLRIGNTLDAIFRLHAADCLNDEEQTQLRNGYCFLRRLEHRIQIVAGTEQPFVPTEESRLTPLVASLGYDVRMQDGVAQFQRDLAAHLAGNRAILERVMGDVFADSPDTESQAEFDLVLDPAPPAAMVESILGRYGFADPPSAYQNLMALAVERSPFLSTRRCRHSLAALAPRLLAELGQTAAPDTALSSLCRVSDSLGAKGVLWELLAAHPPSLQLYVRLCAASPYLSTILISNPGMLDELTDSMVLDQLPSRDVLNAMLDDWCRGTKDFAASLMSFKNAQHLNAGVRDLLGKESVRQTTAFLADVAQCCLQHVCDEQIEALIRRRGEPWHASAQRRCELIVIAVGKFGGREPNYHSDLDVLYLYECEGTTRDVRTGRVSERSTDHQHFFNELAQQISKFVNQLGPQGRLYDLDTKLRTTGQLATSIADFEAWYADSQRTIGDHLALCRARVVYGSPEVMHATTQILNRIIRGANWQPDSSRQVRELRAQLELGALPNNLKRGPGGLVDVELLTQTLQLKNAGSHSAVLETGTIEALSQLCAHQHINEADAKLLTDAYLYLRAVEARLRLMNTRARHDLPQEASAIQRLASLMGEDGGPQLEDRVRALMRQIRDIFERLLGQ